MLRKAQEIRIHTDEQVGEIIDRALEQAERVTVPEDLREAVFVQACGVFAQKQVQYEQLPTAGVGRGNGLIG